MGPVRRGLSAALATLLATPAWAEVCAAHRPMWEPGTQANVWTEAVGLLSSPLGLLLLILSALAVRFRWQWLGLATIIGWTGFVSLVSFGFSLDPQTHALAVAEGCIGAPTLFIVISAAICVMIVFRTKPHAQS